MPAYTDSDGTIRQQFQEIADVDWWLSNPKSTDAIAAAALLSIDRTLKRIENNLLQLGYDGLHEILRDERRLRRREQEARRKRIARKRARTIARRKVEQG